MTMRLEVDRASINRVEDGVIRATLRAQVQAMRSTTRDLEKTWRIRRAARLKVMRGAHGKVMFSRAPTFRRANLRHRFMPMAAIGRAGCWFTGRGPVPTALNRANIWRCR